MGWNDDLPIETTSSSWDQDTPIDDVGAVVKNTPSVPEPFKDTSRLQDDIAAIGGGLYGAGIGTGQLGVDIAQLIPGMGDNETLARWEKALQGEEASRRSTMDMLKTKYGAKGFYNPMSWMEFTGEALPYSVVGGGRAAAQGLSKLPGFFHKYGRALWEGGKWGTIGGASLPIADPEAESRLKNTAIGAGAGAVAGPVVAGAADLIKTGAKYGINTVKDKFNQLSTYLDDPKLYEEVYKRVPELKRVDKDLRKVAPVTTTGAKTGTARARIETDDHRALFTISQMKDDILLNGEKGRVPQTQGELLEAIDQAKELLIKSSTELAEEASKQGARIDLTPVIRQLQAITPEKGATEAMVGKAQQLIKFYTKIQEKGGYDPVAAVNQLSALNNDIKSIYTGKNTSGEPVSVLAMAANNIRNQINKTVDKLAEGSESAAFSKLRKDWGALNGLEERAYRTAEKYLNKEAKGGMSMLDIISAEQAIHGLVLANPKYMGASLGTMGLKGIREAVQNPDTAVSRMMMIIDELNKNQKYNLPTVTPRTPSPPKVYDPSTGLTGLADAYNVSGPTGPIVGGQTFVPNVRDISTGASVPPNFAAATPRPQGPIIGGQPYRNPVRDPATGTLADPNYASGINARNPMLPANYYADPMATGPMSKVPTPVKGDIMDGYMYKGGDPMNPANWTKVE